MQYEIFLEGFQEHGVLNEWELDYERVEGLAAPLTVGDIFGAELRIDLSPIKKGRYHFEVLKRLVSTDRIYLIVKINRIFSDYL